MKQNIHQELEAALMEDQQILEDQQWGGIYDDDRKYYLEYLNKQEEEKYELERAEMDARSFVEDCEDYGDGDDYDDYDDDDDYDEDGGYLYGIL